RAAVSLADTPDPLVGLFASGERPTGSRDPYGLRRQAHGVLRLLVDLPELTGVTVPAATGGLVEAAAAGYVDVALEGPARDALFEFLGERLQYVFEARGYDARNIRA